MKAERVRAARAPPGKSDLRGRLTLENAAQAAHRLRRPLASTWTRTTSCPRARSPRGSRRPAKPPPEAGKPAAEQPLPPMVREMEGTVKLAVERGRASGIDYRDLRTDVTLKQGRLQARTLEVGAFGRPLLRGGVRVPAARRRRALPGPGRGGGAGHRRGDRPLLAGHDDIVTGKLSGKLDLKGVSVEPEGGPAHPHRPLSGQRVRRAVPAGQPARAGGAGARDRLARGRPVAGAQERHRPRGPCCAIGGCATWPAPSSSPTGPMEITTPLKAQTPSGPLTLPGASASTARPT